MDVHARDLSLEGARAARGDVPARQLLRYPCAQGVPQHELQGDFQLHGGDGP